MKFAYLLRSFGEGEKGCHSGKLWSWRFFAQRAWVGCLFAVLASLIVGPVVMPLGWPSNHEGSAFFLRTSVYQQHLMEGDWLPIWSSRDNFGFGSPLPVLYHKTFYVLSGLIFAASNSMKFAICASVVFWMVVGAIGMSRLAREAGCNYWTSVASGVMLIAANYTTLNWLVRGAMAEFSAAMLVPWTLAAFIASLKNRRAYISLGVSLGLVFLSHSVMAYFLVLLMASVVLMLRLCKWIAFKDWSWKRVVFAPLVFGLLTAPYLLAMHSLSRGYDLKRILPSLYRPENNYRPLTSYVWDPNWHWGVVWDSFTVQLDSVLLILLGISIGWLCYQKISRSRAYKGISTETRLPLLVLISSLVETLLLQTSASAFFYKHFPGAEFLQFPWRLLAIATPLTIALAVLVCTMVHQRRATWWGAGAAACIFLFNGAYMPITYPTIPIATVMPDMQFSAFNEYVPVSQGVFDPVLLRNSVAEAARVNGCSIATRMPLDEGVTRDYSVACSSPSTIVLPLFASPMHALTITSPASTATGRCGTSPAFPALCSVPVPAGPSVVTVHFPTFASFFRS